MAGKEINGKRMLKSV